MPEEEQQQPSGEPQSGEQMSEEQIRAQLEEEIRQVRVEDLILQSVVSILNLSARRIAKDDERDLEQAKTGIDAGRALVDLVKPEAQGQLRQAISELQLLYAKHAGEGTGADEAPPEGGESPPAERGEPAEKGTQPAEPAGDEPPKRGPGLWTPPGS